jgi:hypothetical protein
MQELVTILRGPQERGHLRMTVTVWYRWYYTALPAP